MIKVASYIDMVVSDKFKNFLSQPFNINMLYQIDNVQIDMLFDGWRGKNMGAWYKFTNDDNIILEFYPNQYITTHPKSTVRCPMPLPLTLSEFINDMNRFKIQLYWSKWVDENFEPKEYLRKDEISNYFVKLLERMGKSHELLL